MKNYFSTSIFKKLFGNGLAYIFLVASLFIYAIILDWNKISKYVSRYQEADCEPVKSGVISFGIYDSYQPFDPFKFIEGLFYLLSLPSVLVKEFFITELKSHYSHFCPETFDVIGIVYFLLVNSIYWMILGYFVELAHNYYSKTKTPSENSVSIFKN